MKVLLKRAARIEHKAGEIVEVSPAAASFLISVGSAEEVTEAQPAPPKKTTTKAKATK